jgi:hypothetical protein
LHTGVVSRSHWLAGHKPLNPGTIIWNACHWNGASVKTTSITMVHSVIRMFRYLFIVLKVIHPIPYYMQ